MVPNQNGCVGVDGSMNQLIWRFTLPGIYNAALTFLVGRVKVSQFQGKGKKQNHKAAFTGPWAGIFSICFKTRILTGRKSCRHAVGHLGFPIGCYSLLTSLLRHQRVTAYKHRVGSFPASIWCFRRGYPHQLWRRRRMQTELENQVSEWLSSGLCWQEANSRKPSWFSVPF